MRLLLTPTLDASSPTTAAAAATAAAVAAAAAASGNLFFLFQQGKLLLRYPSSNAAIQPPRSMSLCCNAYLPVPMQGHISGF